MLGLGLGLPPMQVFAAGGGGGGPSSAFLLRGNGTDGSTTFTDEGSGSRILTPNGTAQIDTEDADFPNGAPLFAGGVDYIDADSPLDLGDEWTVEAFIKGDAFGGNGWRGFVGCNSDWQFYTQNGSLRFRWTRVTNGVLTVNQTTPVMATGVKYHVAAWRTNEAPDTIFLAIDGSIVGQSSNATVGISPTVNLRVGEYQSGFAGNEGNNFAGHLQARITRQALYGTESFTAPTTFAP